MQGRACVECVSLGGCSVRRNWPFQIFFFFVHRAVPLDEPCFLATLLAMNYTREPSLRKDEC